MWSFLIVSVYFFYSKNHLNGYTFATISIIFFVISLFNADLLLPINKLWMYFGYLIGKIISPVVLAIIFFGLFTPYGLVMRMFGRDELHLKQIKKK